MRLLALLLIVSATVSCGTDRSIAVRDRGGQGDGDGKDNTLKKLQRAQNDSVVMAKMTLSRFEEVAGLAQIIMDDPTNPQLEETCPAVVAGSIDQPNKRNISYEIHWDNCNGRFDLQGDFRVEAKYKKRQLKSATVLITASTEASYIEDGILSYPLRTERIRFRHLKNDGTVQLFKVYAKPFILQRSTSAFDKTWRISTSQSFDSVMHFVPRMTSPEPSPAKIKFSQITAKAQMKQQASGESKATHEVLTLQLNETAAVSLNNCGYPKGSYTVTMKTDRLQKPLEITRPLVVSEDELQDPFGGSLKFDDCRAEEANLPFVKENIKGLFTYKVSQ